MTARRRVLGVGIVLLVALALPGFAGAQEVNGIWESRSWDDDRETDGAARIHLNLEPDRGNWRTGFGIDIDGASGPLVFDGEVRNGRGTGFFTFIPDDTYISRMAELGYPGLLARAPVPLRHPGCDHRVRPGVAPARLWRFA